MTPTEEQRAAIQETDHTVLLSAAAGSGKTATLTRRLIEMIVREENPLDVTRMLIVTFTRAAAEELRTRIASALADAAAARPNDPKIARQLLLFPSARIRTIDAFCNDLVKGNTEQLNLSPFYRIGNEAEIDLLGAEMMDEVIEDAYTGAFAPNGLSIEMLVEIAESVKNTGSLSEHLYALYRSQFSASPKGISVLKENAACLEKEAALPFFSTRHGAFLADFYRKKLKMRKDLLMRAYDELLREAGPLCPTLQSVHEKYFYILDHLSRGEAAIAQGYSAVREHIFSYKAPGAKQQRGYAYSEREAYLKQQVMAAVKADMDKDKEIFLWEEKDLPYAFRESAKVSLSVFLLLQEFEKRFAEEKRRRGICSYADIEKYAYTLLYDAEGNLTPLAHTLKKSFDAICIDEYQDVNELQHRIFSAIATENNRFMVGDIKQSIYGFRGAEPSIFADLRDPERNDGLSVLFLTQNFRSERNIIDFANCVFDFLFPQIKETIGYVSKDRLASAKDEMLPPPSFYLLEKPSQEEEEPALSEDGEDEGEEAKEENALIAWKILSLLQSGYLQNGKKIQPSDIAVLSRGGSQMQALIETLRDFGIPLKTEDKSDFFARKEILLALCLCHTVNNPHRDLYLSGLLRSPLFRFTMNDLLRIRAALPEGTLFDALRAFVKENPDFEKGKVFLATCADFRLLAQNTPAHRLIRTMFERTGIYAATDKEGKNNLRVFYEVARSFESTSFQGLYRFLKHISDMQEHGALLDKHIVGTDESVTVSTIHKSKGLEYPVCILAHTASSLSAGGKTPPFAFSKTLGLSSPIREPNGLATLKSPLTHAMEILTHQSETEEAVRVLYVALTRPKEQLYLFCAPKRKKLSTIENEALFLQSAPSDTMLFRYPCFASWILAALGHGKTEANPVCRIHTLSYPYAMEDLPAPMIREAGKTQATKTEEDADDALGKKDGGEAAERSCADWKKEYLSRFGYIYPHAKETELPAKLSVSSLYPGVLDDLSARSPFDAEASLAFSDLLLENEGAKTENTSPTPIADAGQAEEKDTLLSPREKALAAQGEDFTPTIPAFLREKEAYDPKKAGTATHLFLQFCDFDRILLPNGCQKEDIEAELARLCEKGFLMKEDALRVRISELSAFASSPLAKEIRQAKRLYREFRFHVMLPASAFSVKEAEAYADLSLFTQGVIDLLLERKDGSLLLLDYKTDRIPREAKEESAAKEFLFARHKTQLTLYAEAVAKIFGKTPQIAIYSLHAGKLFTL